MRHRIHDLGRVFAPFDDFCALTPSLRHGVAVDVRVFDGEGRMLLDATTLEAGG